MAAKKKASKKKASKKVDAKAVSASKKRAKKKTTKLAKKAVEVVTIKRKVTTPKQRVIELRAYMGPKALTSELAAMRKSIVTHAKQRRADLLHRMRVDLQKLRDERAAFDLEIAMKIERRKDEHVRKMLHLRNSVMARKEQVNALRKAHQDYRKELLLLKKKQRHGSRGLLARNEMIARARQEVEASQPDLLPYFESVKMKLRNRPKLSAYEQFLQLVHDDPDRAIRASAVAADRKVEELIRQGEKSWETRAKRLESRICERAHRLANKGLPFRLKGSEAKQLTRAGYDIEELEMKCHRPTKRIVSRRGSVRPEKTPF